MWLNIDGKSVVGVATLIVNDMVLGKLLRGTITVMSPFFLLKILKFMPF